MNTPDTFESWISSVKSIQAIGIFGSPKFTKASARAMRAIATFQETRWFINAFTYFPLSFCLEDGPGSSRNIQWWGKEDEVMVTYLIIQIIRMLPDINRRIINNL